MAVLFGILKTLDLRIAGLIIAASWVAITAVVREAFGSTAVGGGVLALGFLFAAVIGGTSVVLFMILAAGIPFAFVKLACLGIDGLDRLLRTKPKTDE